jgi:hypothetical protein
MTEECPVTSYKSCVAATREFVRAFQAHDCASMILPMLYLVLCDYYNEARVQQRFGEVMARDWLIKDEQVGLVWSYFMESVRMVETPEGDLAPVLKEEEPNKAAFLRRLVESNKLLPPERRRGRGATNEVNMRRYLDRAIEDHGSLIAEWRKALSRGNTRREVECQMLLSKYSGQPF